LIYTCQHMHTNFGQKYYSELKLPQNKSKKREFLFFLDPGLPQLYLCHPCAQFHIRKSLGSEQQATKNSHSGWWYNCSRELGFADMAQGYLLGWSLIQLTMRAYNHSPQHGIPLDFLEQKWEDSCGWRNHVEASIINRR